MREEFLTGGLLMEAVRKLDYKAHMDSFLYETDVYSPEEFYKVVRDLKGLIEGANTDGTNGYENKS